MGMFKEEICLLETLAKRQRRIWADALDYGIYKKDMSKAEVERLRDAAQMLLNLPGSKVLYKVNLPAVQRQYQFIVMWGRNGKKYDASRCKLSYYKDRKREFFTIDIDHVFTNEKGEVLVKWENE